MSVLKILEDTRQQAEKHTTKHQWFEAHEVKYHRCALPVGDYALFPKVAIDTKKDMGEIAGNIGGSAKEHARFRNELMLAKEYGCQLYVLVENKDGIKTVADVREWVNPRLRSCPQSITGERLSKAMRTMEERYGVRFLFAEPGESASIIKDILEIENAEPRKQYKLDKTIPPIGGE